MSALRFENAIGFATFFSRSHDAVIRVYDEADNVIETHEQAGEGEDRFDPGRFKNLLNTLPGSKTAEGLRAF
jgi:hypothetical protein